ncbi:MAG: B12-binding domain-containing radical SAM protein [Candidatus Moranbacteria bacterium]|nr:B12-binding domain-containing radical SAM protein [Candidatus Moranbacteria bacterium]
MHILFIRPGICGTRTFDALPPLSIGVLAARTPPDIRCTFVDDALGEVYGGPKPDLVAITTQTFSALRAYDLAEDFRSRGVPVVLGGYHPTLLSDEASRFADAVVIGDAEGVWEMVIDDARRGVLRSIYRADQDRPLHDVAIDRSIFLGKNYPKIELASFTRGCRFSCDFCAIKAFYPNVRSRSLDLFSEELQELDLRRILFIVDDNIYTTPKLFRELLAVLRNAGAKWACQISIDVARDEALVEEMARSGCMLVIIGFESLDPLNLKQIGKRWNVVSGAYPDVVARFHRHGIAVYGTFVFGYDADTLDTIESALEFAVSSKLEIANFNPLTPMPGSRLYERLLAEKRLLRPTWWLDRDYRYGDPIFVPRNMDAGGFVEKCYWAKREFYSWRSMIQRLLLSDSRFDWYRIKTAFAANVVSHREIMRKQHKTLGG